MNPIQALSGDEALKKDMSDGSGVYAFLNSYPAISQSFASPEGEGFPPSQMRH
jgi:hypothetical protein